MNITIEPFSAPYRLQLIELMQQSLNEQSYFQSLLRYEELSWQAVVDCTKDLGQFWLLRVEDQLKGYMTVMDIGSHHLFIHTLFLLDAPDINKLRVLKRLIRKIKEQAKKDAINMIYIGINTSDKASYALFENLGFGVLPKALLPAQFPELLKNSRYYDLSVSTKGSLYDYFWWADSFIFEFLLRGIAALFSLLIRIVR